MTHNKRRRSEFASPYRPELSPSSPCCSFHSSPTSTRAATTPPEPSRRRSRSTGWSHPADRLECAATTQRPNRPAIESSCSRGSSAARWVPGAPKTHNGRRLPRYRPNFLQNERVTHAIRKHKYLNTTRKLICVCKSDAERHIIRGTRAVKGRSPRSKSFCRNWNAGSSTWAARNWGNHNKSWHGSSSLEICCWLELDPSPIFVLLLEDAARIYLRFHNTCCCFSYGQWNQKTSSIFFFSSFLPIFLSPFLLFFLSSFLPFFLSSFLKVAGFRLGSGGKKELCLVFTTYTSYTWNFSFFF